MDGKSLREICDTPKMPNRSTVLRWMNNDEEFAAVIARARSMQADALDDEIQQVTNDIRAGVLDYNAGRVIIWAMQWRASKMRPQRYGDKLDIKSDGSLTVNIVRFAGDKG